MQCLEEIEFGELHQRSKIITYRETSCKLCHLLGKPLDECSSLSRVLSVAQCMVGTDRWVFSVVVGRGDEVHCATPFSQVF